MRQRRLTLLCCAAAMLLATGCGPTSQDVVEEYRDRFTQRRKELAELATRLPPKGSVTQNACATTPDPRPFYFNNGSWALPESVEALARTNTDVVTAEQLVDPDASVHWNLFLSDSLVVTLQWTGPRNPMAPSASREAATAAFKQAFERALSLRYIVVTRVAEDTPPKVLDERSFLPGRIALEGFLLDAKTGAVLCTLTASAESDDMVKYEYRKLKDNPIDRAAGAAHFNLWQNVRARFIAQLTQTTGGKFQTR